MAAILEFKKALTNLISGELSDRLGEKEKKKKKKKKKKKREQKQNNINKQTKTTQQNNNKEVVCVVALRPCQQLRSCRAGHLPINTVPGQA